MCTSAGCRPPCSQVPSLGLFPAYTCPGSPRGCPKIVLSAAKFWPGTAPGLRYPTPAQDRHTCQDISGRACQPQLSGLPLGGSGASLAPSDLPPPPTDRCLGLL